MGGSISIVSETATLDETTVRSIVGDALFDAKRFQELSVDGKLASGVLLELLEQNECPEKEVAFQELDAVKTTVSCSRRF